MNKLTNRSNSTQDTEERLLSQKLIELAERCEKATGPDRDLNAEIIKATLSLVDWITVPDFTASLDAAMTLVPEGASIDLRTAQTSTGALAMVHPPKMRPTITCRAATPALALCAAALKARSGS